MEGTSRLKTMREALSTELTIGKSVKSWKERIERSQIGHETPRAHRSVKSPRRSLWSADVLQRELDSAVAALAGDLAERGAGGVRVGAAPVRVVHCVEQLGAKLQVLLLSDGEIFANTEIPLPEAGVAEY